MPATALPPPDDERQRLDALAEFALLDTPPEQEFDRLVSLAARLFDVPIALISLLDSERQFFKARIGIDVCETRRDVSFCTHAIAAEGDAILFVPDATRDPRFADNPLVLGPPFVRFYAGKPLVAACGEKLGTICLIDTRPRARFDADDRRNLNDLAALVMDRMELRRMEQARAASQRRFENIAATSPDAIICSTAEGRVTFWNGSAERLFGYTASEMEHLTTAAIVPEGLRRIYEAELARLQRGEPLELADRTIVLSGKRKDGSEFPAEYSMSTWDEGDGRRSVGAIVRDISERDENEKRLFRLASLDALTDLPNRGLWQARFAEALSAGAPVSVLLLDLDGFKDVNDTLGHSAGDAILRAVAGRIQSICPTALMVARFGGDEFAVLLPGDDLTLASAIAEALVRTIAQPFDFAGEHVDVGVSVGIAISPLHGRRAEELLSAADLALYRAKSRGRGRFEVFEPVFLEAVRVRRTLQRELRSAYENGEFELYYQPQVSTHDGHLTGAEALLRWNHPHRGLQTPANFIKVLAEKPSSVRVGEWILRTACRQAAEWRGMLPDFRISVNLFESQLRSRGLCAAVEHALEDASLPAAALELELVEDIVMRDDIGSHRTLEQLRAIGVGLAFDDYGTGFASLNLLKRYPVTRLKIDRTFIRSIVTDAEDAAVVRAILYLGTSFGLDVVAEGVETREQLDFLVRHRCSEVQGYLFGEPMTASRFAERFLVSAA